MLIDEMMDACVYMNKAKIPDGQGGSKVEWTEGAPIDVAIVLDTSIRTRIAESEGFTNSYTLTTKRDTALENNDVIKRLSDGLILRVTNDVKDFPSVSAKLKDYSQVSAEKWRLT